MIYLIAAILCSSGVTLTLRFSKKDKDSQVMLAVNYIVAALFCLLFMKERAVMPDTPDKQLAFALGVINGVLFLVTLVVNRVNIRRNGTPLTASFSHLGVLIPVIFSMIIFGEQPTGKQWLGVALALAAILIINLTPAKGERAKFPLGLVLLFTLGGCTDMMSKIFEKQSIPQCDNLFLFYTFMVAFFICVLWAAIKNTKIRREAVIYGLLLGVFNYFSSWLLLKSVMVLPAFLAYPMYSVGVIVVINIINRFFLKEEISKWQYVGMGIICLSLLFL